jgi:hypothetical protein
MQFACFFQGLLCEEQLVGCGLRFNCHGDNILTTRLNGFAMVASHPCLTSSPWLRLAALGNMFYQMELWWPQLVADMVIALCSRAFAHNCDGQE